MGTPARPSARLLAPVLAPLLTLALALGLTGALGAALVAPATAATQKVRLAGNISNPDGVTLRVSWFTKDWVQVGTRKVHSDVYVLHLKPGVYHVQFTDLRPTYDTDKYAPSDVTVKLVRASKQRNVRMRTGAAVVGTIKGGNGKALSKARIVAADANEVTFSTTANRKGQYALAGLPPGSYSLFTWDRDKKWVARSTYVAKLTRGEVRSEALRLTKKAGSLLVDLRAGASSVGKVTVTAVSKKTGQWWTVTARGGTATFSGLFPGGYTLVAPGWQNWFARTGVIKGALVHAGRTDFSSSFRWTTQGGRVKGRVISSDGKVGMEDVTVELRTHAGKVIASGTTDSDGRFLLGQQLRTQSHLSLVVIPNSSQLQYYKRAQRNGLSVHVNKVRAVGTITLTKRASA
ncbi:carboxypeptidase-like regulatory domain-containing protein [Nocardioides sp. GY 10127]|uniref:MSCRAMM family protein n=1 Tax=Nocardioides sp. GY 10127 TaxID=2569762 RepID=UPI0010A935F7|nr:carboxypeptidase-like regulatory domain-containing protein [Nocardioides sp. GY 10127]TIC81936.1 carboxypeptidase regulatory-like domain-containing protein [Nocardioides sp. GY 10127]